MQKMVAHVMFANSFNTTKVLPH